MSSSQRAAGLLRSAKQRFQHERSGARPRFGRKRRLLNRACARSIGGSFDYRAKSEVVAGRRRGTGRALGRQLRQPSVSTSGRDDWPESSLREAEVPRVRPHRQLRAGPNAHMSTKGSLRQSGSGGRRVLSAGLRMRSEVGENPKIRRLGQRQRVARLTLGCPLLTGVALCAPTHIPSRSACSVCLITYLSHPPTRKIGSVRTTQRIVCV